MALTKCAECGNSVSTLAAACPKCGAPIAVAAAAKPAAKGSRWWVWVALIAVLVLPTMCGRGGVDNAAPQAVQLDAPALAAAKAAAETRQQRMVTECTDTKAAKVDEFRRLLASKKEWEAAGFLRPCAEALGDAELLSSIADAEQKSHMRQMIDPTERPGPRMIAIDRLKADYPAFAAANAAVIGKAEAKVKADQAAEEKKERAAMLAERRKRGVTIGMTQEEVLQSNWGKPQSVNRSTYSFGVHEQWVYGSGNYLYFKDGKLESIQN